MVPIDSLQLFKGNEQFFVKLGQHSLILQKIIVESNLNVIYKECTSCSTRM